MYLSTKPYSPQPDICEMFARFVGLAIIFVWLKLAVFAL